MFSKYFFLLNCSPGMLGESGNSKYSRGTVEAANNSVISKVYAWENWPQTDNRG